MPGQPDWQRFQSSAATFIYNEAGPAPLGAQHLYVGPWRSLLVDASDSGNGEVWDMFLTWANDKAGTQIVQQVPIILSTGWAFVGFVPVLAPYLSIGVTATVTAPGQSFTCTMTPTLIDPPTLGRFLPRQIAGVYEQALNHNNFTNVGANMIHAGPARITLRTTGFLTTFDLQYMLSNGTWQPRNRYQTEDANLSQVFETTLPYNPVRIQVTNNEAFQQIKFDAAIEVL